MNYDGEGFQEAYEFWTEHGLARAYVLLDEILPPSAIRYRQTGKSKGHHIAHIGYSPSLDLNALRSEIKAHLNRIDWQFVTTGASIELNGSLVIPSFGIAPIIRRKIRVAYHATRLCVIPSILNIGLIPSNSERRVTSFADTEGLIHVCEKLKCKPGENDCAEWWRDHLSYKNLYDDPCWGILRIDLASLPEARVYQDMHSQSGLVVDEIERIPPNLITLIRE
jgi:hypothetical protein